MDAVFSVKLGLATNDVSQRAIRRKVLLALLFAFGFLRDFEYSGEDSGSSKAYTLKERKIARIVGKGSAGEDPRQSGLQRGCEDTSFEQMANLISTWLIAVIVIVVLVVVVHGVAVFYCLHILDKKSKDGGFVLPSVHIVPGGAAPIEPPFPVDTQVLSELSSYPTEVKTRLEKMRFTYTEVLEITSDLRVQLGKGGFGSVYYGKLKDGRAVAVKRLSSASAQGTHEFINEVEILSRAHHKNLVSLLGFCCELDERCLVYEFMSKGTLEDRLHGVPSEEEPLPWLVRLKIAVGAAKGFAYLHNDCHPSIIHRDVKCSNILLDDMLVAKVADFGLSKPLPQSSLTHQTTGVKGTFGYLDPEYAETGRLTKKSDVYSYGVILLELLSGNKAVMQQSEVEYIHIGQWARPYIVNKTLESLLDKRIGDIVSKEAVEGIANMALRCVAHKSSERPFIEEVLGVLEAALSKELPCQEPKQQYSSILCTDECHTVVPIIGATRNGDESTVPILHWTA